MGSTHSFTSVLSKPEHDFKRPKPKQCNLYPRVSSSYASEPCTFDCLLLQIFPVRVWYCVERLLTFAWYIAKIQLSSSCVSSGKDRNRKYWLKPWYGIFSHLWSVVCGHSLSQEHLYPPNLTVCSERVDHEGQKYLLKQGDHLAQFWLHSNELLSLSWCLLRSVTERVLSGSFIAMLVRIMATKDTYLLIHGGGDRRILYTGQHKTQSSLFSESQEP